MEESSDSTFLGKRSNVGNDAKNTRELDGLSDVKQGLFRASNPSNSSTLLN